MRQLLPHLMAEVDPLELYPAAPRPPLAGRPWVMMNMVCSIDGAIAIDGTSGSLGGPADQEVFAAVRACADWIVAAAGTVRAERYGLPRGTPASRAVRAATGRTERPRLAVVSGSLDLDLDLPLFGDQRTGDDMPLILTGADAAGDAVTRFADVAEVVRLPSPRPTPPTILTELAARGAAVVLSEGGPSFNGQLVDAGVVDEFCLSTAPMLVGGLSPRTVHGSTRAGSEPMTLAHLLEADGLLFARYVNAARQRG